MKQSSQHRITHLSLRANLDLLGMAENTDPEVAEPVDGRLHQA
jgi:hypothetical protein